MQPPLEPYLSPLPSPAVKNTPYQFIPEPNGAQTSGKASNTVGDITLYDDFLTKLASTDDEAGLSSSSWPDEKEAVGHISPTSSVFRHITGAYVGLLQTILEPFTYLAATPGKDMRSQLIDAFNVWLNVPLECIEIVKQVVGQLHTASLLYVRTRSLLFGEA